LEKTTEWWTGRREKKRISSMGVKGTPLKPGRGRGHWKKEDPYMPSLEHVKEPKDLPRGTLKKKKVSEKRLLGKVRSKRLAKKVAGRSQPPSRKKVRRGGSLMRIAQKNQVIE